MKPVRCSATRSRPATSPRCSSARCAFISDSGRRCEERKGLQFDHVPPVAKGGKATVEKGDCCAPHMTSTRQAACSAMGS